MPRGVYDRTKAKTTKAEIKEFVMFCFRPDIAKQLESVKTPHLLAVKLYKQETGKEISPKTAYSQKNKWIMVNGEIYKQNQTSQPQTR